MKLACKIEDATQAKNIVGIQNANLKILEELFACQIDLCGDEIVCDLKDEQQAHRLNAMIAAMLQIASYGIYLKGRDLIYLKNMIDTDRLDAYDAFLQNRKPIAYTVSNKPLYAKTLKQKEYLSKLDQHDLIFALGAAGSGKTYLAVVYAVMMLKSNRIGKIILTRPAVEAGESLGFLPGDFKEKVDPYLRPLYDALYDLLGMEQTNQLIEKNILEIAPLAYMRGRTLEDAIVILDEAQNATSEQLKMFLTRLGFQSKMIVTGDPSQIDLPNRRSGLKMTADLLADLKEVAIVRFDTFDVVRHPLVAKIIERFEKIS